MTVETFLVLFSALSVSAFSLGHLYWRPLWLFQWQFSQPVKGLGLFALFFQVVYGLVDVSLGVIVEQLGSVWAENLRIILGYNSLAATALITDFITSGIAYYLFYLAAFQALAKYQDNAQVLQQRAFNFMLVSINITLLIKVLNLFSWQLGDGDSYIREFSIFYLILVAFIIWRLVRASAGLLQPGATPLALLLTGVLFPLSEPVLGNAYQFIAFLVLIRAVSLRIKPEMPAIESKLKGELGWHQLGALFMLLAFSMSCLPSLTVHMTAFSPIDNMFRNPVTVSLIYQTTFMLLLVGLFSSRWLGKVSAVSGIVLSPITYFLLMPYTELFLLKEGSQLVDSLSFWNESVLYGTSMLWLYGLLIPVVVFAFVAEDNYGELNRINLQRMLQRNLLGIIITGLLGITLTLLLLKPGVDGVFEVTAASSADFFKQELLETREILSVDSVSTQKKIAFIESMSEMASVFIDETRFKLYKNVMLKILLVTAVCFLLLRSGQFTSLDAFLRYIRKNYPKSVQRTAVKTLNSNRSLIIYFSVFRSISLIMGPAIFVCLCAYVYMAIEGTFTPAYEYQRLLMNEQISLEKMGAGLQTPAP